MKYSRLIEIAPVGIINPRWQIVKVTAETQTELEKKIKALKLKWLIKEVKSAGAGEFKIK